MKQRTKLILVTVCLLIPAIHSYAQNGHITISGILLDSKSKEPLPFASIYVREASIGTTSSAEGSFVFHIPSHLKDASIVISMIGYTTVEKPSAEFMKDGIIYLQEDIMELAEVVVTSEKPLTARQIVKRAYKSMEKNYPSEPYILEGFIRDLQNEDGRYVELLEYAAKMRYKKYNAKVGPAVELQEVRRSYIIAMHPWNKDWERKNSIVDLLEDDFIRFDYGPIKVNKGWNYELEAILPFGSRSVYKIKAINKPFQEAVLFIDRDSFAFVRIELSRSALKGRNYKRRLTNGQQEVAYHIIFEYQEYNGKMYLKYQKEEDTWKIFEGLETEKLLFTKYPKKELFINRIITESIDQYPFNANLQEHRSIEDQANPYNPDFWEYYNAPAQTQELSKIEEYLKNARHTRD